MSAEAEFPDLSVLVVADNVDAATSRSYLLQLLGCKTAVAFGATMGLRVAQLFQPALVLLDLDMPGQDGCEVLAEAKKENSNLCNAWSVCLTGRDHPEDEERCIRAGFDLFVRKPLEPAAMQAILIDARRRALLSAMSKGREPSS